MNNPTPEKIKVFPTPVGVFPKTAAPIVAASGLPHARGGVSYRISGGIGCWIVFPTPVGVFPL